MGVLIPLFSKKEVEFNPAMNADQRTRVRLLSNSIEALKKEEKALEDQISQKCKSELDRLNDIEQKVRQLETEIEQIRDSGHTPSTCPKR